MPKVKGKTSGKERSSKRLPPAVTWIGGILGGFAAIVGSWVTVGKHWEARRPAMEAYYYRVEPAAVGELETMVGDAFAKLGGSVRFLDNECLREARNRTSGDMVKRDGEMLLKAYFLGLRNTLDIPLAEVRLEQASGDHLVISNVPSATGILICYQIDVRGTKGSAARYVQANYRSSRGKGKLALTPPNEQTLWTVSLDARGIGYASEPEFKDSVFKRES